jgi:hypothetical protein
MKLKMTKTRTERGFAVRVFTDRYGHRCSLQKSSLATEAAIWFGVEKDAEGRDYAVVDAERRVVLHCGEPITHPRMHLTQQMVKDLLPALQHFAKTGSLR